MSSETSESSSTASSPGSNGVRYPNLLVCFTAVPFHGVTSSSSPVAGSRDSGRHAWRRDSKRRDRRKCVGLFWIEVPGKLLVKAGSWLDRRVNDLFGGICPSWACRIHNGGG